MKSAFFLFFLVGSLANGKMNAQMGTVDCSQTFHSDILNRPVHFSIYLPEGYQTSDRSYPVLYLLHGMWDNYTAWVTRGEVNRIASACIRKNEAPEMIIVMPDGLTDAFYINTYDNTVRWEDFFYSEFMPYIEKKYRIIATRNTRAIAGLSMGGYGSLYHAIRHKDKFKACYAMSAAVLEVEPLNNGQVQSEFDKNFHLKLWGPNNAEGLPANFKNYSIHEMIRNMATYKPAEGNVMQNEPGLPLIFIDCGDDDFLLKENMDLVIEMNRKKIPFEFRVRDGGHTWDYWRVSLVEALKFTGNAFRNF